LDCKVPFVNRKNLGKRKLSGAYERRSSDVRKVRTLGALSLVSVPLLGAALYEAKPVKRAIALPVLVLKTFLVRLPDIENGG
jgi:hypothetical protein